MKEPLANREVALLIELRQFLDDGRFVEVLDHIGLVEADQNLSLSNADRACLLSLKGQALMKLNQYERALEAARAGIELIKNSSDNTLIAQLQATAARALTELGQLAQAERLYRDLIATYRRIDDVNGIIRSFNRLSRAYFIEGQFGKAADALLEADGYARALGDSEALARIAGNLGTILMLTGEFHKAIEHLDESLDLNATLGDKSNLCRAHLSLSYSQMHLGRFEIAADHLDAADELVRVTGSVPDRINLLQYRAQISLLQKRYAPAVEFAASGLELARNFNATSAEVAQIGRLLAQAEFEAGHLDAALAAATEALAAAQAVSERIETAACRRLLALIAHERDESFSAAVALRQLVVEFDQMGARYESAITYFALARIAAEPAAAREARVEALRILRSLQFNLDESASPVGVNRTPAAPATIVGADPGFVRILNEIEQVADSDLPVLLLGSTGTGKDLIAKHIHNCSQRRKGRFVEVNCGAIPAELAESLLFGHERGSFTNAVDTKVGWMEVADGGTLFLNEIGELPIALQVKLLSAIEEKSFYRVGGIHPRRSDFRIIAATNVDIVEAVRQGKFRSDLYFRLAVMTKQLPPLVERGEDAYLLFRHFLESSGISLAGVDARTLDVLKARLVDYDWPGNIREMRNQIDATIVSERRDPRAICLRMIERLSRKPIECRKPALAESINLTEQIEDFERSLIARALELCDGIIRRAADFLGIPEGTLRSKMKKYRISAA